VTIRLLGDRVVLRAFRESEHPLMWDRQIAEADEPGGRDAPERRERLYERLRGSGAWTPDELRLAVEAGGTLVGDIQARRSAVAMPSGVTELGIVLFRESQGKGYGTDALRTLDRYLFEEEAFHRVQVSTDVDNIAMRHVAEKAGFAYEGILRGFWREGDALRDYAMYGRTLADHQGSRADRVGSP